MRPEQKMRMFSSTAISLSLLLSACGTGTQTGNTRAEAGRIPPTVSNVSDKTRTIIPLPYEVKYSKKSDDRLLCENCGNTGEKVLVTGGERFTQYNMMVISPYFDFLCTRSVGGCWSGKWIAINKNLARPYVEKVWLGSDSEIRDLVPANDRHKTWLQVTYANGTQKIFEFENDK
ncbi:hypothetical protein [Enterobacter sp. J706]|uniref:hypothetical protein n=1 Tax=Enterobacter sp. J706 TaxID=3444321 RepID=UPI003EBD5892|nr:hypothetical protein [Klebsiella sp. T2.Ur]